MAGFVMSEWIEATPDQVFNFMIDPDNGPKAMESVISSHKLTDGPVGVGTRFSETRLMKGKEHTSELEVIGFEAPEVYAVQVSQSGIDVEYHYDLSAENEGTRLDLTCNVRGGGLKKLMLPVVAAIMKKEDGDHLQMLKRAIEKDTII